MIKENLISFFKELKAQFIEVTALRKWVTFLCVSVFYVEIGLLLLANWLFADFEFKTVLFFGFVASWLMFSIKWPLATKEEQQKHQAGDHRLKSHCLGRLHRASIAATALPFVWLILFSFNIFVA